MGILKSIVSFFKGKKEKEKTSKEISEESTTESKTLDPKVKSKVKSHIAGMDDPIQMLNQKLN